MMLNARLVMLVQMLQVILKFKFIKICNCLSMYVFLNKHPSIFIIFNNTDVCLFTKSEAKTLSKMLQMQTEQE